MNKKKPPTRLSSKLNKSKSKVKLLFYDVETAPNLSYTWGKWEQNVIEFERDWYILSFAYKWRGGKTKVVALPDFPRYKRDKKDDKYLIRELWKLFNEATITVAHNNKTFDNKKANTRFIQLGLPPPAPYKVFDTLPIVRKYFKFDSNKLDDLGRYLGIGRKVETGGYVLWRECLRGNMKAWRKMKKYNATDVDLLERLYLKLLPWVQEVQTREGCPKCGSSELQKRGYRFTVGMRYQRLQCKSCGGWSSERKGEKIEKTLMSL